MGVVEEAGSASRGRAARASRGRRRQPRPGALGLGLGPQGGHLRRASRRPRSADGCRRRGWHPAARRRLRGPPTTTARASSTMAMASAIWPLSMGAVTAAGMRQSPAAVERVGQGGAPVRSASARSSPRPQRPAPRARRPWSWTRSGRGTSRAGRPSGSAASAADDLLDDLEGRRDGGHDVVEALVGDGVADGGRQAPALRRGGLQLAERLEDLGRPTRSRSLRLRPAPRRASLALRAASKAGWMNGMRPASGRSALASLRAPRTS